jgi:hypothetical protein
MLFILKGKQRSIAHFKQAEELEENFKEGEKTTALSSL